MNKSDLIEAIAKKQTHLTLKVVDLAVDCIIEGLCQAAVSNERIEIRGFGAFSLHHYPARLGRNPKSGEYLNLSAKYSLRFKPGKQLRDRVNTARLTCPLEKED
jgi:integration host factor subunit beta